MADAKTGCVPKKKKRSSDKSGLPKILRAYETSTEDIKFFSKSSIISLVSSTY
jgi:hypothetical protein